MTKKTPTEAQRYGWYKKKLRLLWNESPMKHEAMNRAKTGPAERKCEKCGKVKFWKLVEVDHIDPVVSVTDPVTDVATYAARMNCPANKLQVLCADGVESCHHKKSKAEDKIRRGNRGK